jgi:phosphoribosylaminoimidazolecarboxamide formyltransferase / IMP cyclohydrolase
VSSRLNAALISVSDRTGIVPLAQALARNGVGIYATGGTCAHLREHGIEVHEVGALTGFPSLFGGRVKTLHPRVFGGILKDRDDPVHTREAQEHGVPEISWVIVNLYPFEETVSREGTTLSEALEQIDIGGVSLIRAAAKNFAYVTVLTEPDQYDYVLQKLPGEPDEATRRLLATRAFGRMAEYDSAIARYLETGLDVRELPGSLALTLPLAKTLRYGENPQSRAAFYLARTEQLPEQLHGKELSYNNLLDLDATLRLMARAPIGIQPRDYPPLYAAVVSGKRAAVVKHTVPCGVAERPTIAAALREALGADSVSAFGGIIAVDGTIDAPTAEMLNAFFLEIVAAPAFDDDALALLKKKKHLRIIRYNPNLPERLTAELRVRSALGGVLAEDIDAQAVPETWQVVSKRPPNDREWLDIRFAWDVVRHVKSNGVVVARDAVTRGICAGQTNRVSAVRIAAERAGAFAQGAACASDGFFPFADGLDAAVEAGCSAVIAPGGSIRDAEVIAAANAHGITLIFSSHRYFLH